MPTRSALALLVRSLPALHDLPGHDPDDPARLAAVGLEPFDPAALAAAVTADLARIEEVARATPIGSPVDTVTVRERAAAARRYAAAALVLSCLPVDVLDGHRAAPDVANDFRSSDLWDLLLAEDRGAFFRWLHAEEDEDAPERVRQRTIEQLARQVYRRAERTDERRSLASVLRAKALVEANVS